MFIMLPTSLSSGSHSPLLTQRIFMRSWYSRSGSSLGVMRKYCALSASHVTFTIESWTLRSARTSMPYKGMSDERRILRIVVQMKVYLVNLIDKGERCASLLCQAHQVQDRRKSAFLAKLCGQMRSRTY
jgi:hypothetical protein